MLTRTIIYLSLFIFMILIYPVFMVSASAPDVNDPGYWTDMGPAVLNKGESYTVNNYTVEFVDYMSETGKVQLSLKQDDMLLNESILNATCTNDTIKLCNELDMMVCDWFNWNDEIIIAVCNETDSDPISENPTHWPDPRIHIKFFERAKPQILLDIDTNCEVYSIQDSQIIVTVDISNEGDAEIENVTVTINPGDLSVIRGDCTTHFSSLLEVVGGDYLFSWNKVPGKHDDLLLRYLKDDLNLDWITKDAYISKSTDDKTISVSGDGNLVEITLNEEKETASLNIKNGGAYTLEVKGTNDIHTPSNEDEDVKESITVRLRVPAWINEPDGQAYSISANATGFDGEDVMYTESVSTEILVMPKFDLKLKKTVTDHTSMDQLVWVYLNVENTGKKDLTIELNDSVPSGFDLYGNESLNWKFNLTPSKCRLFSYQIVPSGPGINTVPPAVAEFRIDEKSIYVRSNSPNITVDGACITMNKTAYPKIVTPGDAVNVTLIITNTGNQDACIDLKDIIPDGACLISGNTSLHTILCANQSAKIEYIMNFSNPGNITLGSPTILLSGSGYSYITASGMPVIEVEGSSAKQSINSTSGTDPEHTSDSSSGNTSIYEIIFVMGTLAVVFLIGRFMQ